MPAAPAPLVEFLVCRHRHALFAFPLDCVAEIMRPLPIEPMPQAPAPVEGIAQIRGEAVPVIGIAQLLGWDGAAPVGRFVALRVGAGRSVAVAVEDVLGVQALSSEAAAGLPPLVRDDAAGAVAAIAARDAELVFVLRAGALLPDAAWPALEPRAEVTA